MSIMYNKAIRDKIPEIIMHSGKQCKVTRLPDEEFLLELERKLEEEITEYQTSKSLEELADIIEVILRILELKHSSEQDLKEIRILKKKNRGAFSNNLFLLEVY